MDTSSIYHRQIRIYVVLPRQREARRLSDRVCLFRSSYQHIADRHFPYTITLIYEALRNEGL